MNEHLVELALACGATHAAALPADQISLDAVFRDICQSNACGNYGQCYMCPPDVGEVETLMGRLKDYRLALVYQTVGTLEDTTEDDGVGVEDTGTIGAAVMVNVPGTASIA